MSKEWHEDLTTEQEKLTEVIAGLNVCVTDLFRILTKEMDNKRAIDCKIGYIKTTIKELGFNVEDGRNKNE